MHNKVCDQQSLFSLLLTEYWLVTHGFGVLSSSCCTEYKIPKTKIHENKRPWHPNQEIEVNCQLLIVSNYHFWTVQVGVVVD